MIFIIRVRFLAINSDDVCELIETHLNCGMDIDDWIVKNVKGLSFDGTNYPYDLEECYDCYFESDRGDEYLAAQKIFHLLTNVLADLQDVSFKVCLVNQ